MAAQERMADQGRMARHQAKDTETRTADGRAGATARRWLGALLGVVALAVAFTGPAAAEKPRVVTTTPMIGDAVAAVAGETAEVDVLIGQGVDPHLFKATRADIARLLRADAVFYNGLFLEGKLTDALERVAASGKPVHAVAESLPESVLIAPAEFAAEYDPHVWMDPTLWSRVVDTVAARLSELVPEEADGFAERAEDYKKRLGALDKYAAEALAGVPPEQRVLVTAHDAFGYFGRRYGFEVVGIQGISTESEAGLARIEAIVDLLVERRIPAVFTESSVSDRAVQALVAGAGAVGHQVAIGGTLYSDSMGAPGTYEGTYPGMIDHNVTTIARALGADVPAGGLNGRLASR